MPQTRSKYEFQQDASLSQQLSAADPIYQKLAGADPKTSRTIGVLEILGEHKIINLKDPNIKLMMDLLNVRRKALFATSDKVNEITKMGLQMPKSEDRWKGTNDDGEES
jgi:hypothetical protein